MYNSRRHPPEDIPQEVTTIWSCTNNDCKGWIRDNFTFSIQPVCPQCQSDMVKSEKMLPIVANNSPGQTKT